MFQFATNGCLRLQHMAYEGYLAAFGLVGLKNPIGFYGEVDGARDAMMFSLVSSTMH